ncbi:OsmC family peroxiredoxin [bacterium]|nr:OsmC family peroxiredoxin [bacterium]
MKTSKSIAIWEGDLKEGEGLMKPEHTDPIPFGAGTRFEDEDGSNPEELLGAALAGCFSMALALALGEEGASPRAIQTAARVSLASTDGGFTITDLELSTEVNADGIDSARLKEIATRTKESCPVSRALAGVERTSVAARLISS